MKIDIFPHILPSQYLGNLINKATIAPSLQRAIEVIPTLSNLDMRFRIMDKYEGLMQVLTMAGPPLESVAEPKVAAELAKIGNDEMAELVAKYPDKFVGAVACLPLNDIDLALNELDRAIRELNFRGVQIYTSMTGKPLDSPEFMPIYEKMANYNLPIWIHPERGATIPDYSCEDSSKYGIHMTFGWPYETSVAMTRVVFGGVLEKYPNLKLITHHCGGMIPYFEGRIVGQCDVAERRFKAKFREGLTKPLIDYFRMFFYDTVVTGSTPALMCAYAFCGADHMLFATDMPFDDELGNRYIRETIRSVEEMAIPIHDKCKIFEDNARKLLRLPI